MTFRDHFLDSDGSKLDQLLEDLNTSINSLKTWWNDPNPIPINHHSELDKFENAASNFVEDFPTNSLDRQTVFTELLERLENNLRFNVRNMAQQHPTPILESLIASFLVNIQNPNSVYNFVSPPALRMEKEVITWISDMIGFQKGNSGGNVVSGGTIANLSALTIARNKIFPNSFERGYVEAGTEDVPCPVYRRRSFERGYVEAGTPFPEIQDNEFSEEFAAKGKIGQGTVIASSYAHYSIEKSCKILGIGDSQLGNFYEIPVDDSFKTDIEQLESHLERFQKFGKKTIAVVSVFGTTETGFIEPIEPILKLKEKYNFYYLVDAAHGGWALTLKALEEDDPHRKKIEKLSKGIERADAITIDPHKLGFLHYPAGCIILKNKEDLKMLHEDARYLANDESYLLNPGSSTIEGSRSGSPSVSIWTAIKTMGMKGYAELMKNCLVMTEYFSNELQKIEGIEVFNPVPDLNLLCFRIKNGEKSDETKKICDKINESRKFYIGTTEKLANRPVKAIRMCIMNPHTTNQIIDEFVGELKNQIRLSDLDS